jgi:hypothetical protein
VAAVALAGMLVVAHVHRVELNAMLPKREDRQSPRQCGEDLIRVCLNAVTSIKRLPGSASLLRESPLGPPQHHPVGGEQVRAPLGVREQVLWRPVTNERDLIVYSGQGTFDYRHSSASSR